VPGWLLGWPYVWSLGVGEVVEIEAAGLEVWREEDVWQGDGGAAVGGGNDGNDNAIPLHLH
jgi:hypothetical protein